MFRIESRIFRNLLLITTLFGFVFAMPVLADGPLEGESSHYELLIEFNQGFLSSDAASKPYLAWLTLQPGYFFESGLRLNGSFGTVFVNPGSALIIGGKVTYRIMEPMNIPIEVHIGAEGLIDSGIGNQDFEYVGSILTVGLLEGVGGVALRWGYESASKEQLVSLGINIAIIN